MTRGKAQGQICPGKKYMLRIINAALNEELFFKIAGHSLTVVEVDATYVKPFKTGTIFITPGQTTNAILEADLGTGNYLMAASPFMAEPVPIDYTAATATVHYSGTQSSAATTLTDLPPRNATPLATAFVDSLKSLNSQRYPARVPLTVDHSPFHNGPRLQPLCYLHPWIAKSCVLQQHLIHQARDLAP